MKTLRINKHILTLLLIAITLIAIVIVLMINKQSSLNKVNAMNLVSTLLFLLVWALILKISFINKSKGVIIYAIIFWSLFLFTPIFKLILNSLELQMDNAFSFFLSIFTALFGAFFESLIYALLRILSGLQFFIPGRIFEISQGVGTIFVIVSIILLIILKRKEN